MIIQLNKRAKRDNYSPANFSSQSRRVQWSDAKKNRKKRKKTAQEQAHKQEIYKIQDRRKYYKEREKLSSLRTGYLFNAF